MLEVQSKDIEGTVYKVRQLDALKGRKVFLRFARLVGPALAEINGKSLKEESLARVLGKALEGVQEEDLDYFCDTFAQSTCVVQGSKEPQLDKIFALHFAANYYEMVQWLIFCFEVNFGSFFQKLGPSSAS